MWIRWAGYSAAFATVLPGVFITSDLFEHLLFGRRERPCASENEELAAVPDPLAVADPAAASLQS